ncbi:MAG: NADPH:quinone oxidoreductase family protein [Ktedonobacteraceae bacterium]|nr:NADPH:quinone oxidoreductase family protein [Ktedonobacteraceae bacterium]
MRAVLCKEFGPPESLVLEEVEPLKPGKGQVVIGIRACGLNFPDALMIQGKYQFRPPMPFSPGSEVAGIIKEVGEGVTSVKQGDRVIAVTGSGGFAEEIIAAEAKLISIPAGVDFVTAAAFTMAYGTSYHALKDRAHLASGNSLLVLGAAGGVGLAAVEIGKFLGARVIAAASTDEKLAICKQYGADEVINYTTEDLKERVKSLTRGQGVDVTFDPVGGNYAEAALRSTGWKGRYLVIGFASGEIPRIPLNLTLLKGSSIVGVFWGAFTEREPQRHQQNLQELLTLLSEGKLKPHISATYPLEQAATALDDMMQRKVQGKAVVLVE